MPCSPAPFLRWHETCLSWVATPMFCDEGCQAGEIWFTERSCSNIIMAKGLMSAKSRLCLESYVPYYDSHALGMLGFMSRSIVNDNCPSWSSDPSVGHGAKYGTKCDTTIRAWGLGGGGSPGWLELEAKRSKRYLTRLHGRVNTPPPLLEVTVIADGDYDSTCLALSCWPPRFGQPHQILKCHVRC